MKTNIIKKLLSALCAVTISISIINPTKAIQFNGPLTQSDIHYLQNANESIHSCLEKLEIIRKNISNSTKDSQDLSTKEIINLLIDDLSNTLNKINDLEIQSIPSLKNAVIKLNDLSVSLNSLLTITKNNNKFSKISDGLFEARSNLYQIYDDLIKYNKNTKVNNDYNSNNEEWWDQVEHELDILISESEFYLKKRNVKLDDLYRKCDNISAGLQSKNNCWLFASQNIANYFLFINGQNPIKKFNPYEFNESIDIVEKEFLKRMPVYAYFLRNGQTQHAIRQYLQTYGIYVDGIYVSNDQPDNEKRKTIMKKIAYFLLVHHFSCSDTPIATNVGNHWITLAGIDIYNKIAMILDPSYEYPRITTLDDIANYISTMSYEGANKNTPKSHIVMLFPHSGGFDYVLYNNFSDINWNIFKSHILSIASK